MIEKIIDHLFAQGGLLRVRGLGTLVLVGGFVYMGVTGIVSPEVYIALTGTISGLYAGARFMQDKN